MSQNCKHDLGQFLVVNDRKRTRNAWAAAKRAERFRLKEPSRPANGPFGRSLVSGPDSWPKKSVYWIAPQLLLILRPVGGSGGHQGHGQPQQGWACIYVSFSCSLGTEWQITSCKRFCKLYSERSSGVTAMLPSALLQRQAEGTLWKQLTISGWWGLYRVTSHLK